MVVDLATMGAVHDCQRRQRLQARSWIHQFEPETNREDQRWTKQKSKRNHKREQNQPDIRSPDTGREHIFNVGPPSWSVRSVLWCLTPKRGWLSKVPIDVGIFPMQGCLWQPAEWTCVWSDATMWPNQIEHWCSRQVSWGCLSLGGRTDK